MTNTPEGVFTDVEPAPERLSAARLESLGVIRLEGEDAATFLHNQITNRVLGQSGRSLLAAWCQYNGRIQTILRYAVEREDSIWVVLPAALVESVAKRLKMFVLRSKVTVTPLTGALVYGLSREACEELGLEPVGAGEARFTSSSLLMDASGKAERFYWIETENEAPFKAVRPEADFLLEEMKAGCVWVWPSTVNEFVPQMLRLDEIGGVVFDKGCYPGQEVVSRLKFVGRTNRLSELCAAGRTPSLTTGEDTFMGDEAVGTTAQVVHTPEKTWFVQVRSTKAAEGPVCVGPDAAEAVVVDDFTRLA